ncbi:DEAD/DEAH box helicase [Geobacter sp.]|uniref:DEAD/DEAH box helicase n=1 Tax=Geobacter sp. TaxID=46610 RepID=UPI0026259D03|nr:DEAD/DEAH box helicase [Geobacter sp.]
MEFTAFNLHPQVAAGVRGAGYTTPTPIQAQAIPPVMAGRDVMGLAQTGTGKTAAFVLPILHRLMAGERGRVRALIIAPTRELAEQIHQSVQTLGLKTRLRSVTVYGGVGVNPQVQKLRAGAEVVVACPGRLLDHINQGTIDLSHLEVLVLDEADQMFDMGFLPDIRRILKHLPARRQTLLFSATMPPDIRTLAHDILSDPVTVQVGNVAPAVTVTHALYPVEQHLKTPLLLELLRHTDTESVLVFTRTKHRAKRLGEQLEKAGYRAASLQGNLSQNRRQAALDGFRDGTFQILVATDIAARGIDVSQVSHVINYDIPDTAEAYIHRIGRTGRAARSGDAFTMVTRDDAAMVRTIERTLNATLERRIMDGFDYSVQAPKKDTEFARPPRQPMPGRKPAGKPGAAKVGKDDARQRHQPGHGARTAGAPSGHRGRQSRRTGN